MMNRRAPSRACKRRIHPLLIGVASLIPACSRPDPLATSFEDDHITHLEIVPSVDDSRAYRRIGDAAEVERFERIMRGPALPAPAPPPLGTDPPRPAFWVHWSSGRECFCRLGEDRKMRFWHLELTLDEADHEHLVALRNRAEDWAPVRP